jgi:peptide/nickel transport system substrate-binding protein
MKLPVVAAVLTALIVTPALAQKSKDTLRMTLAESESYLDPYLNPGSLNNQWEPSIWDSLLGFDSDKDVFLPLLAKSWSQPDPTTYDYEMRDDVKWTDGQPLTADDVVYTLNYITDPKVTLRYKSNWNWVKSVEKIGPNKVRITSKQPAPDGMMWMTLTSIFPKHLHEPLADKQGYGSNPVGTGPYKVVKLDKNAGLVAERNPAYKGIVGKPAAPIGRVTAEPLPDAGTVVAKMMAGDIDIARDMPADLSGALRDSGRFETELSATTIAYTFLGFPTLGANNVKALGDQRVRLAMIKAIDRSVLVETQYGALANLLKPVEGLCDKAQLGCGYTKLVPDYDPEGAKKLLAEAGYAEGFDLTISTFPTNLREATAVSGLWRKVGIRATVKTHLTAQRVQMLSQGKVDVGYYGWSGGGMFEVSPQIVRHFLSNEYADEPLTKMASETQSMMDDAARRQAVAKVMDYANEKAYLFPMVPIQAVYVHTKDVKLNTTGIRASSANPFDFGWK